MSVEGLSHILGAMDSCVEPKEFQRFEGKHRHLILRCCKIGDDGMRYLSNWLKTNHSVDHFEMDLWDDDLRQASFDSLADAVRCNDTLTALNIEVDMSDSGRTALLQAIQYNGKITTFGFGMSGSSHLHTALRLNQLPSVQRLAVYKIESEEFEMLATNQSITSMHVDKFTSDALSLIIQALQTNRTLKFVEYDEEKADDPDPDLLQQMNSMLESNRLQNKQSLLVKPPTAFDMFCAASQNPDLITLDYIKGMLPLVNTIHDFRFVFTLACSLHRDDDKDRRVRLTDLSRLIYARIQHLIDECALSTNTRQNASVIAIYTGALRACAMKGFIGEYQHDCLVAQLGPKMVFSDARFLKLEQAVKSLTDRIEVAEANIDTVAANMNRLRRAMENKKKRDLVFGVAKVAVALFMAGPVLDLVSGIFDYADVIVFGAKICDCSAATFIEYAVQGTEAVKENMDSAVDVALRKLGYDPDLVINAWIQATIVLSPVPVGSSRDIDSSSVHLATLSDVNPSDFDPHRNLSSSRPHRNLSSSRPTLQSILTHTSKDNQKQSQHKATHVVESSTSRHNQTSSAYLDNNQKQSSSRPALKSTLKHTPSDTKKQKQQESNTSTDTLATTQSVTNVNKQRVVNEESKSSDAPHQAHMKSLIHCVRSGSIDQVVITKLTVLPNSQFPSKQLLASLSFIHLTRLASSYVSDDDLDLCTDPHAIIECVMTANRRRISQMSTDELKTLCASFDIDGGMSSTQKHLVESLTHYLDTAPANFLYKVEWASGSFELPAHRLNKLKLFLLSNSYSVNEVKNVTTFKLSDDDGMPF